MSCTSQSILEGGTLVGTSLINPSVTNPSINGGISVDDATASQLAEQLCRHLASCIEDAIHNNTFTGLTLSQATIQMSELVNTTISGTLTLGDSALNNLVTQLCPKLTACISEVIAQATLSGNTVDDVNLTGSITMDTEAAESLFSILLDNISDAAGEVITEALSNLSDLTLNGTTTFGGDVVLSEQAKQTLATSVISQMVNCDGDALQVGQALATCTNMNNAISQAVSVINQTISNLPVTDRVVAFYYDEENTDVVLITKDSDGVNQQWNLDVSRITGNNFAISSAGFDQDTNVLSLVTSSNGVEQTFTVDLSTLDNFADQVTNFRVDGDNLSIDTLDTEGATHTYSVPLQDISVSFSELLPTDTSPRTSVGQELPTTIAGSDRAIVLGTPNKWLEYEGGLIPWYSKV